MQTFEITHWITGAVLYSGGGETLRDVVEAAVRDDACLDGANLVGARLDGARLDGARLDGARLVGANLVGANLVGARLVGARLDGASLDGARLDGANLVDARLDGARLVGARLDGARLVGANLVGANLVGARLVGWRPIFVIGPIGSRCDYLASYITDAGIMVRTGCFCGSLDKFRSAVIETHGDSIHGREYIAAIAMIEAHADIWRPVEAAKEAA